MLDDEKAPTQEQRHQIEVGKNMALTAAVHALIASHPDTERLAAALDVYANETAMILVLGLVLQKDDGMRQSYSETFRSLRSAIQQR